MYVMNIFGLAFHFWKSISNPTSVIYNYGLWVPITFCLSAFVDSSDWPFSFSETDVMICAIVVPDSRPSSFRWSSAFFTALLRSSTEELESSGESRTWGQKGHFLIVVYVLFC